MVRKVVGGRRQTKTEKDRVTVTQRERKRPRISEATRDQDRDIGNRDSQRNPKDSPRDP